LPTVIHVVDDDASFRTAIGRLLRASGYEVALYESAKQLLEELPDEVGPSCILLDVQIPGLSGPELQDRLAQRGSKVPIVFLTGHGDIPTSVHAIKAGADDFLTKPVPKDMLLDAITRAVGRYQSSCEQRDRLNMLHALVCTLTPRQRQVFELVVRGKMNKQIAHELGATERTIKAHRQKVMEKARVQSLAELVSIAERLGILGALPAPGESQETSGKKPQT
jgi:FixJ family two-component response regulator